MWLWTRQEAKRVDELSIQSGMAAETLMETAGQKMALQIFEMNPLAHKATVICGPGNNGGDGFVVARELSRLGLEVLAVEIGESNDPSLRNQKKSEFQGRTIPAVDFLLNPTTTDLWVDGLFGIGLSRPLEEISLDLIQFINGQKGMKIALDTPSGLDVNTGNILGVCFRADATLTVGHPKPGFYLNEGPWHSGQIQSIEIGFPKVIIEKEAKSVFLLTSRLASRWIPRRRPTDNKTHGGRTLIWAGSDQMPGAALLASRAAIRAGSGYVFSTSREVVKFSPETIPWVDGGFSKLQSVLIGPGLGTGPETGHAIEKLKGLNVPVVIDADALTVAAREHLYPFPKNWIATPHAGELSRFLDVSASKIEAERIHFAKRAQELLGCPVLLKGFHTVVAYPRFSVIVPTGNVALAKGGSGDVLGGMIAGFLSQGISPERAPLLASFLHGRMSDEWVQSGRDLLSLTPSDLLERLPVSLKKLREQRKRIGVAFGK